MSHHMVHSNGVALLRVVCQIFLSSQHRISYCLHIFAIPIITVREKKNLSLSFFAFSMECIETR